MEGEGALLGRKGWDSQAAYELALGEDGFLGILCFFRGKGWVGKEGETIQSDKFKLHGRESLSSTVFEFPGADSPLGEAGVKREGLVQGQEELFFLSFFLSFFGVGSFSTRNPGRVSNGERGWMERLQVCLGWSLLRWFRGNKEEMKKR